MKIARFFFFLPTKLLRHLVILSRDRLKKLQDRYFPKIFFFFFSIECLTLYPSRPSDEH